MVQETFIARTAKYLHRILQIKIRNFKSIFFKSFPVTFGFQAKRDKGQMGIHGLTKLLGDCAPSCMKENEIKNYFGRTF